MRVAMFSTKPYDLASFADANAAHGHDLVHLEPRLTPETVALADGCDAVCAFVNDDLGATVLERLAAKGIRTIALLSAGFNHVDLDAAARLDLSVSRVPAYSPHAVAEHALLEQATRSCPATRRPAHLNTNVPCAWPVI